MARCLMCKCELTDDTNSLNLDCGGDCLLCMADCGDPDCIRDALKIAGIINGSEDDINFNLDDLFNRTRNAIRNQQATDKPFKETTL